MLLLCIARLWVMPLFSSFWVDEMATVFVVRHGAADRTLSVAPQVPDSIYYALPRLSQALLGGSEFAYRLPSLAALALALWLIAGLARRLIHPAAGWVAVFACLALRDFNAHASEARPYALGICAAAAGFWLLVRWLDSANWRDAMLFGIIAALLWRIHLIFWPVYGAYALYAGSRLRGRQTSVSWKVAVGVFAAIAIALAPVAKQALALNEHAAAHVVAPQPFPFETSSQVEGYAGRLSANLLAPSGRFFIYGSKTIVEFWRAWFRARPELARWRNRPLGAFGDVAVVEFESPALPSRTTAALASAAHQTYRGVPERRNLKRAGGVLLLMPARVWEP